MKIVPNVGKQQRIAYVIVGAILIALPFIASMEGWARVALPVVGAIVAIEGLAGW